MAQRFIALDWDQGQLHVVAASIRGGAIRFERAVVLDEKETPNPGNAEQLGALLRQRLKDAGIAPAPVLACLGRDRVILKEIRYPLVPPHEEPGVVRFQAVKELSEAAEDVALDYVTLPGPTAEGDLRAQVFVVRIEVVRAYQVLCQAAGLKLVGLTPRPLGMAACLRRLLGTTVLVPAPEPAGAAVALVTVGEKWAEFCILKGQALLQARPLSVGPGLAGEIKRNLAVHAGQAPQSPVAAVYLALSGEQASLREKLVQMLDVPVHPFDPFAGAERTQLPSSGRGTFAGAIGLLHLRAESAELPVNFLQTKQPRPPRNPNQRLYVLAACLALVLVGGGILWGFSKLKDQRDAIAELEQEEADLNRQLAQKREESARLKALAEWETVIWPDELYEFTASLPEIRQSFKVRSIDGTAIKPVAPRSLTGAQRASTGPPQDIGARPVARMHVKFDSTEDAPLNTLSSKLLESGDQFGAYYRPEAHAINRGVYEKDFYIRKRPPGEYKEPIKVQAAQPAQEP